jgi:outer membrane immunogenic protein
VKKNLSCVIALLTFGTAGAGADELPVRPAYFITGPTTSLPWTGVYLGVNGGYGWDHSAVAYTPNDPAAQAGTCGGTGKGQCIPSTNYQLNGAVAGGQIGYNWQINSMWLTGIEADYQWADITATGRTSFHLGNVGATTLSSNMITDQSVKSFGTVRVRLGAIPVNPLLLYGTGGLAFGKLSEDFNVPNPLSTGSGSVSAGGFSYLCSAGGPACFAGSSSNTALGWTVGGGGEVAIANNITFKTEILYVQFDGPNGRAITQSSLAGTTPASFTATFSSVRIVVARAGINYRF